MGDIAQKGEIDFDTELANRFKARIWTSAKGSTKALTDMNTWQIKSAISACRQHGNKTAHGYATRWLPILEAELDKRYKAGVRT